MWKIRDASVASISEAHLRKLGISSEEEIEKWLKKGRENRYRLPGTEKFEEIVSRFKYRPVYIDGDYDVDGIAATAILCLSLKWRGFTDVRYRIPKRFTEGYGMNKNMIDEIKEENVLIITVDNGIAAPDVVAYAREKGHTVIVTDHHEPAEDGGNILVPKADLVIDPKAFPGLSDYDGYCGAGIAYKLARHMLRDIPMKHLALLTLAALGTACDQMPVREENFFILKTGLQVMNSAACAGLVPAGLNALKGAMGISAWTEDKFTFQAGPAINSAERMENGAAADVVRMFTSENPEECRLAAEKLIEMNSRRKQLVAAAVEQVTKKMADASGRSIHAPIIEYIPDCSEGITGIMAGRLVEKFGLPAGIFADSPADGSVLKGSFRAPDGFDIMALINRNRDMFEVCGGHAAAAGATVKKDRFDAMVEAMHDSCPPVSRKTADLYDFEISNRDIVQAIGENVKFAPFGQGNEDLVFRIRDFCPICRYGEWKKPIGGGGFKLYSRYSEAVGFNIPDVPEINGDPLTIYGTISMNIYKEKRTPQIMILGVEKQ